MDPSTDFLLYVLIGFAAQLVDGALGMAYGVTASTMLLGAGLPPVVTSATVHAAECFTTGVSAISHRAFGNIDRRLFMRLLLPGVAGAAIGAYLLTRIDGDAIAPWIAGYLLLLGLVLLRRAVLRVEPREVRRHIAPLGFFGALVDAIGGGGWGPIVTSHLLARGGEVRLTIGSVSAVEFFVTLTASIVFLVTLGTGHWDVILALAVGGVLAAPLGAWLVGRVPARPLLAAVGLLVVGLSIRTLWRTFA
ncbi:sulfite exporter TauE/SafE family protein [Lysobacter humi (ex Lee et al. 2017)]